MPAHRYEVVTRRQKPTEPSPRDARLAPTAGDEANGKNIVKASATIRASTYNTVQVLGDDGEAGAILSPLMARMYITDRKMVLALLATTKRQRG